LRAPSLSCFIEEISVSKQSTPSTNFSFLLSLLLSICGASSAAKTILVLNPWATSTPSETPVAFFDGATTGLPMSAATGLCGWYQLSLPNAPTQLLLKSSITTKVWGADGSGSAASISLASLSNADTMWISTNTGEAVAKATNPGIVGICPVDTFESHRVVASGERCDLFSGPLSGNTGCMDLSKLDGATLTVPASATRLSTRGLVLCGRGEARVPGTDIVYIIDQSGSMTSFKTSQFILPHGKDTINFKSCGSWKSSTGSSLPGTVPQVTYLGYPVKLLDSTWFDSALANCEPAGDPWQDRANVVQAAIVKQAAMAPSSQAAWIGFGTDYQSSKMFSLSTTASRDSLVKDVIRQNLDKTYYAPPVGWARAMLQGATSGSLSMPASPNKRKAIIMVSDGAPNDWDSVAPVLKAGATVTSPTGAKWILPEVTSPPVYGFMLSTDSSQGTRLKQLAAATGGQYYLIPPLDRDSLNHVMDRLMGLLIDPGIPDSLRIQNLSNGQVSNAVAAGKEGGGFRFQLDSLIGLVPGKNELVLRDVLHNANGDTVLTAHWTLDVTDSDTSFATGGTDSLLMAACFEPTRLRVRPSLDSSRRFADGRDTALRTYLDVRTDGQSAFGISWKTSVSNDAGARLFKTLDTSLVRASFDAVDPWVLSLKTPVMADGIVQTHRGWDTLRAVFRMARDPRDSAVALLPLFHAYPVSVALSPDTASGAQGRIEVMVSDSNLLVDSTEVLVKHRLGDSLRVVVRKDASGLFRGSFPFRQNVSVTVFDTVLQMGLPGAVGFFDTVQASYQGARDTSYVLHRLYPVEIRLAPDTASGLEGRFQVALSDSNLLVDSTEVLVKHRLGDSLRVVVRKDASGLFRGSFPFRQNMSVTVSDTVLQMGPARASALDSVVASWNSARDTALVKRIEPVLRFVDAVGNPLTSFARDTIDPGQSDTVRVGLFVADQILSQSDSVVVGASSWLGAVPGGLRLAKGLGAVVVTGLRPGIGGTVVLKLSGDADSLVAHIDVAGYGLRFLDDAGGVHDSLAVDTLVRTRVRVRLQLWSATGAAANSGVLRLVSSDASVFATDSSGMVDSVFRMEGGRATLWLRSDAALHGASVFFAVDSLGAKTVALPLAWRAPAPDSAVYLDRDGDGAVDQIRAYFRSPWNPVNVVRFPWPDSSHILDVTKSVVSSNADSTEVAWTFATGQSRGATAWLGSAVRGSFAWSATEPASSFAIREAVAPVPLRAWLVRGDLIDTLRVVVSESVKTTADAGWLRLGRPSRGAEGDSIARLSQSSFGSDTLQLVVDTTFPGGAGDSIRLAASPDGGVADLLGNEPGIQAAWVPLEIGKPRFKLDARPWPAISTYRGWGIPSDEPALSWFTRPGPGSDWKSEDGRDPRQELSHYAGVAIRTNRDLDAGVVFLYDNSGVSVATLDLAPLFQAVRDGRVKTNSRGDVEVWVAWNGKASSGSAAASGVYLARVLAWRDSDGERAVVNRVFRLGWNRHARFRQED